MAIVTCLIGLHYGHTIVHFKVIKLPCVKVYFLFSSHLNFGPQFQSILVTLDSWCLLQDHRDRIFQWMILSSCLLVFGLGLDIFGKLFLYVFLVFWWFKDYQLSPCHLTYLLLCRRNASKQGSLFIQLYVCHCWCCWHSLCCNLCSGLLCQTFAFISS